ncbi:MAG TPA: hypothetical protein VFW33_04395 [Gemmataceae bacterium]|nr:hypothetical protein [Gemmataceae bacterium]
MSQQPRRHDPETDIPAWAARADELAVWAEARLVVRRDAYGAYTPPERRGQSYTRRDGTTGTVPQSYTAKGQVTHALLVRHFRGRRPEHVVGLHSTSTENTCLAARVDIDAHGPDGNDPAANLRAALAWYDHMRRLDFRPLLNGSNGKGGYHLSAFFSEPVPAARLYAFLLWLTDDHAAHGLAVRPEVFPKQPAIREGGYGNWLRLPGRHHTNPYWPEVWDGKRWLAGAEAVAHVLTLTGDPPSLIPAEVRPYEPSRVSVTVRFVPAHPRRRGSLDARIEAYMGRLTNRGEGQGRDNVAYGFACWLLRDLGLSDEAALPWLEKWDRGNSPPKGTDRLREIMRSARAYGKHAIGSAAGGSRS